MSIDRAQTEIRLKDRQIVSIGFISLGCAKNLVDGQIMAGVLLADGIRMAPSPEEADVVLVNTCAFIGPARQEAAEAILRACRHKAAGGCRAVIVTGCLPQRYRDRVQTAFPDVDAFVGVDELDGIAAIVRRVAAGERGVLAVSGRATRLFQPRFPTLLFSGGPFAYLKVAEGCDHVCAFCAIPGIRGRFRSRGLDELLSEARSLLAAGVRELNLISQDTTSYGRDQRGGPDLADLLAALDALDGDFWIRILYGYPSRVTDKLLKVMARSRHIVPYLDLPIQHSHPDMLRGMQRADTLRAVATLPARLRQAVPEMVLRTTCLVGFPGETEARFEQLLTYVEEARFDHLGVFVYSPEEGTPAFARAGAPAAKVAEARRERLMRLQQKIVASRRRALTGTPARALLLRPAGKGAPAGTWMARVPRQAPEVDGLSRVRGVPLDARPGDFVTVQIRGGKDYDLTAVVAANRGS
jgi:ribosomal protein S12 methylthiotransferase